MVSHEANNRCATGTHFKQACLWSLSRKLVKASRLNTIRDPGAEVEKAKLFRQPSKLRSVFGRRLVSAAKNGHIAHEETRFFRFVGLDGKSHGLESDGLAAERPAVEIYHPRAAGERSRRSHAPAPHGPLLGGRKVVQIPAGCFKIAVVAQQAPRDLHQDLVVADELEQDDAAEQMSDAAELDRRPLWQQTSRVAPTLLRGDEATIDLVARGV